MRGYRGLTLLLYVTVTQAGKHYLRQSRVHYLSDRSDQNIQLEHHHYVIDTSLDEYKAGGGVINDDYNEIDDSLAHFKNNRETLHFTQPEQEDEEDRVSVLVPVREVVSILPVDYKDSPLNISFKPLGGEFILEDNLTVTINDQDITEAVIDHVKIILSKTSRNDTVDVDNVLDQLLAENLIVKADIKEETKDPVDIYLELLGDVVKFEDKTNETNEEISLEPLKDVVEETTIEPGIIDYSDDPQYPDFYDDQSSIPEHINQDDLLIGDSFENEGNIDLMSNDKSDFILEETSTEQALEENESFNSAFPELYKDLAIFNTIPKKRGRSDIRVKKRAEIFSDVVEIDTKSEKIHSTPSTTSIPKRQSTVKHSLSISKVDFPKFIDPNDANIDKDLVIKTSAGSLLGHMRLSATGKNVTEFVGVPYAKPPTENLRFKPPQAPEPWTGIMNNSNRHPQCWSSHFSNSWDVSNNLFI